MATPFVVTLMDGKIFRADQITVAGVINVEGGGDKFYETLTPWHRVLEVSTDQVGAIRLELGQ